MADLKTKQNDGDVNAFLAKVADERKRNDSFAILEVMGRVTGHEAKMWGSSIVGFGQYHYRYESGREGDFFLVGFSPRKQDLTLYIMTGFDGYEELLRRLGKHKIGKSCLYIKKLEDINVAVLEQLIERSVEHMRENNP